MDAKHAGRIERMAAQQEADARFQREEARRLMRAEFAKAAMVGLMASYAGIECRMASPEDMARDACVRADALLAALAKDGE